MENRGVIALGHPVAVVSLIGLVVNDHLLKAEFGNWLTGKLSDVFGLIVFPLILATALARWTESPMRWAAAVTGGLFCLIKTVSAAALVLATALSVLLPSQIVVDPTDLLALPAIGIAYWVWNVVDSEDERGWRLPVGRLLLGVGLMASIATSSDGGASETFGGSVVLTADQPAAQVLVETFIDGERVSSAERLQPRWEGSFLGPVGASLEEAVLVEVIDQTDGPDIVTFTLADDRAAPAELHWSMYALGNEGSPGIIFGDATEPATLVVVEAPSDGEFPLNLVVSAPMKQNPEIRASEWWITVDSNSAQLTLVSLSTTEGTGLRAATEEHLLDIDPGGSAQVQIPEACPSTGCTFRLLTVMVGDGNPGYFGPADLRLFSDTPAVSASVEPRPLKKRSVTVDLGERKVTDSSVTYRLDIAVPVPATPLEEITSFLRSRTSRTVADPTEATVVSYWNYHPAAGSFRAQLEVGTSDVETESLKATVQYLTLDSSQPESLAVTPVE